MNDIYIVKNWKDSSISFLNYIFENKYNIKKPTFVCNQYGKKYLKGNELFFSVSHTKDTLAILISNEECGIDIEYKTRALPKHYKDILSQEELECFNKQVNKNEAFYSLYTKKEACFKWEGKGIIRSRIQTININNAKTYIKDDLVISIMSKDKSKIRISEVKHE